MDLNLLSRALLQTHGKNCGGITSCRPQWPVDGFRLPRGKKDKGQLYSFFTTWNTPFFCLLLKNKTVFGTVFDKLWRQVEEPSMLSDSEDAVDSRQWTQHHLAAADIRVPPTMALTPPQGEFEGDCMDVNVRGPGTYWDSSVVLSSLLLWSDGLII